MRTDEGWKYFLSSCRLTFYPLGFSLKPSFTWLLTRWSSSCNSPQATQDQLNFGSCVTCHWGDYPGNYWSCVKTSGQESPWLCTANLGWMVVGQPISFRIGTISIAEQVVRAPFHGDRILPQRIQENSVGIMAVYISSTDTMWRDFEYPICQETL